jgi:hypothetical protein
MTVPSPRTVSSTANGRRPRSHGVLISIPLALTAATYYPVIYNYFHLDDFLNLFRIENATLWEYLLTPHGGHVLLVRNTLFYLSAKLFGPEPSYFFWTVFLTHLLNVYLLFSAVRWLTGSARLACLGATLWGTSPINEGTLGWYSVYGQVVVATAFLPILIQAARLAHAGEQPSRARRMLWLLLALIGSASFGVGLGLALSLPFVLLGILPRAERRSWLPPLASLLWVVPILYVGSHWAYSLLVPMTIPASLSALIYGHWLRAATILFGLVAYGTTQLASSFYRLAPDSLPGTVVYAAMVVLVAATSIAMARGSTGDRRRLIASILMVLSCYGTIAVGRADLLVKLPIMFVVGTERYHYVGFLTLTLLLCVILATLATGTYVRPAIKNLLLLSSLVVIGTGFAFKRPAVDHHAEARGSTEFALRWMKARIDGSPPHQVVYFHNRGFEATPPYWIPPAQFPGWAAVYVIFHPENSVDGKPVRFIERQITNRGRRTSSLIIDFQTWQRETQQVPQPAPRPRLEPPGGATTSPRANGGNP